MGQPMGKWYLLTCVKSLFNSCWFFFFEFLSFADFFSKTTSSKNFLGVSIYHLNDKQFRFISGLLFDRLDVGPNCLHRLSVEDASRMTVKAA